MLWYFSEITSTNNTEQLVKMSTKSLTYFQLIILFFLLNPLLLLLRYNLFLRYSHDVSRAELCPLAN